MSTFTATEVDESVLVGDLADSWLQLRLRGDLILLAETITEEGARSLLAAMTVLARSCSDTESALVVVDECTSLLGMNERVSFFKRRSR